MRAVSRNGVAQISGGTRATAEQRRHLKVKKTVLCVCVCVRLQWHNRVCDVNLNVIACARPFEIGFCCCASV